MEMRPRVVDTISMDENPETGADTVEPLVVPVTESNLGLFLAYCSALGPGHDESYLPGTGFRPDPDHPSFLLLRGTEVLGAASLLLGAEYRNSRRSRFAVLHSEGGRGEYSALVAAAAAAAAPHVGELYLFLPADRTVPAEYLREAGFRVERIAYEMARDDLELAVPKVPPGYRLEPLRPGDEKGVLAYAEVRNRNFREVLGSLPIRVEAVLADLESPDIPPGGLAVLIAPDGSACGTMRAERDVDPGCLSIGALSVDREHRGFGLGRYLLRSAADLGRREGFRSLSLSVNALNKNALGLYESEGFTVRSSWACLAGRVPELLRRLAPDADPA